MMEKYQELKGKLASLAALDHSLALMSWDQRTYMPKGGLARRAESLGVMQRLRHEMFTDKEMGELIKELSGWALERGLDSEEYALLRSVSRGYEKEMKLPGSLVENFANASALAFSAWETARAKNDWSVFKPHLAEIVALNIQKANALGFPKTPYDALLDEYEEGFTTADASLLFSELKRGILPLYKKIRNHGDKVSADVLKHKTDAALQFRFLNALAARLGFDFSRGRLDLSAHPFTTGPGLSDMRITTRVNETWLPSGLYGTIHECGHAFYAMGVNPEYERTPLVEGASLGFHESQSRFWENIIGRSRPFCLWLSSLLPEYFPYYKLVSDDDIYRAVNCCTGGDIRVEADEVSYNLHIMLRFEIERALVEREITVDDAPALWDEKTLEYLGKKPDSVSSGILQDVHWSQGAFGYFPTYTIGNVLSAQIYDKMISETGDLSAGIRRGEFWKIHTWLKRNIWVHGAKYPPKILINRVTGTKLDPKPFLTYIEKKYGEIYGFQEN